MGPGSRLQRGTPFLCDVRFTASLPEVPCDPKLVVEPPSDARDLARFSLTSLERGPLRDVALGEDAAGAAAVVVSSTGEKGIVGSLAGGVCVSLLTPESYEFASVSAPALGAEDATLLVNAERALATARAAEAKALAAASAAASSSAAAPASAAAAAAATAAAAPIVVGGPPVPIARKPQGKELAWLMRTSYVTAAGGVRAGRGRGAGGGGALGGAATAMEEDEAVAAGEQGLAAAAAPAPAPAAATAPVLDREGLLREIDATFAAARELDARPPRHPTKPGELVAVSVRPVLPHARLAGNHHVLVTLDRDPLADLVPAAALAKAAASASDAKPPPPRLTAEEEGYLLSRAVTKSYRAASDPERGEEPEKFLGYMVPAEIPKGLFGGEGGGDGNGNDAARRDGAGDPSTSAASSLRLAPFLRGVRVGARVHVQDRERRSSGWSSGRGGEEEELPSSTSRRRRRRRKSATRAASTLSPSASSTSTRALVAFSQRLSTPVNRPSSIRIVSRGRTEAEEAAARARRAAVVRGERLGERERDFFFLFLFFCYELKLSLFFCLAVILQSPFVVFQESFQSRRAAAAAAAGAAAEPLSPPSSPSSSEELELELEEEEEELERGASPPRITRLANSLGPLSASLGPPRSPSLSSCSSASNLVERGSGAAVAAAAAARPSIDLDSPSAPSRRRSSSRHPRGAAWRSRLFARARTPDAVRRTPRRGRRRKRRRWEGRCAAAAAAAAAAAVFLRRRCCCCRRRHCWRRGRRCLFERALKGEQGRAPLSKVPGELLPPEGSVVEGLPPGRALFLNEVEKETAKK